PDHPLQQEIIADLAVETEAATALVFEAIRRLDRIDAGSTDATDKAIWRTLTPLIKLYTGKQAVWAASEAIEALGGNGYMEDYPTARLLRDAQVLPIWEGTTNILSLDFLFRACGKERGHEALFKHAEDLVAAATLPLPECLALCCNRGRQADLDRRGPSPHPSGDGAAVRLFLQPTSPYFYGDTGRSLARHVYMRPDVLRRNAAAGEGMR